MTDAEQPVGRVAQVWIYPVKSLAGASVARADIDESGLRGDRVWAAVDADGGVLRAKDHPAMSTVAATGEPDADAATLSRALSRSVRLEPGGTQPGAAPVHLVSRQAIDRAAAGEVPEGCSADDPRANLLLDLDGGADERAWVGRRLRVGTAVLEVTRTPKHCLGVYAEVRHAGAVSVGDAVLL